MSEKININGFFVAIIPAKVLFCKDLEFGARLLYGFFLSRASINTVFSINNKQLVKLFDVSEQTIKIWIKGLKEKKFIKIKVIKKGMAKTNEARCLCV